MLIIKPSSLGDIIHGLQVAQSLKAQRQEARITWVAREIFAPLVETCACVDEVIVFQRRKGLAGIRRTVEAIRKREYDWVLDMQGLARSGWMTHRARAQNKAGRRDNREFAGVAYQQLPALPPAGRESHALDILRQFLQLLGLNAEVSRPLVFKDMPDRLPEATAGATVLFPGSRRAEKAWPGFGQLTSRLLTGQTDARIVWAGDQPVDSDAAWPEERFINLTGETSLPELVPLIRQARLCVCNDSGPMHLAAALGTELLAVFGPTPPSRFGPWPLDDQRHHVVMAPGGKLGDLTVDVVFDRIRTILS